MKKILSLLLVCAVCLTAAGCSNEKKETKIPETETRTDAEASEAVDEENEEMGPNGLKLVAVGINLK